MSADSQPQPRAISRQARPWRLQSQGYVLLLGGLAAATAIALINAARLGVPTQGRAAIAGAGLLGLLCDVVSATSLPVGPHLAVVLSLSLRLAVHVVQLGEQKPYDLESRMFFRGDHGSMWLPGATAIAIGGPLEYGALVMIVG
ncbi:hypothetical protein ABZ297_22940 [Nonomuraea sp. NPDC005983]|uniref:hypothetical protein n=1 Tax=Nonomuraea sp. NPDC005983 TaxID=3155595 RepID=UPI0033AE5042